MRTWSWPVAALAGLLLAGVATAQATPFAAVRSWRWRTPAVACVAQDAGGLVVAYAVAVAGAADGDEAAADGASQWELVTYDPRERRETASA